MVTRITSKGLASDGGSGCTSGTTPSQFRLTSAGYSGGKCSTFEDVHEVDDGTGHPHYISLDADDGNPYVTRQSMYGIALDTDGHPYWTETYTHTLFLDTDGQPYY